MTEGQHNLCRSWLASEDGGSFNICGG